MGREQILLKELFKPNDRLLRSQDPKQQIIELEMQQRLIRAKDSKRVTLNENPDFFGNFDRFNPRGTFEMFIESNVDGKVVGRIEDCYGTASFKGTLSPTEFCFVKRYIPEKSSVNASRCDLQYLGQASENGYFGNYYYQDKPNYGGQFWMSKDILNQP